MNEHLVSIIMPVYNAACYIEETVASVLAQTYENWELLITEDCSTDETRSIVERLAQSDERIITFYMGNYWILERMFFRSWWEICMGGRPKGTFWILERWRIITERIENGTQFDERYWLNGQIVLSIWERWIWISILRTLSLVS